MNHKHKHFLHVYTYGSIVILLASIVGALSYFSYSYLDLEQKRAEVLKSHLSAFFGHQHSSLSEETFTKNYESVAQRVEDISGKLGSNNFEFVLLAEDGRCLFYRNGDMQSAECPRNKLVKNAVASNHQFESSTLEFDKDRSIHVFRTSLSVGSIKLGSLHAEFSDPYGLLFGKGLMQFGLKHLLPVMLGVIFLWLLWIFVSRKFFLKPYLKAIAKLEKDAAVTEFALNVGHDIRSPIEALQALTDVAAKSMPPKIYSNFCNVFERLKDLANNLLDVHHDTSSIENESKDLLVSTLLDRMVSEKRDQYRSQGIKISYKVESKAHSIFTNISSSKFKAVLSNLIDNSAESIEGKGNVYLSLKRGNSRDFIISIADTGSGIPKELISKLGKEKITYGKEKGRGLGFYSASHFITESNGQIKINETSIAGTKISISLPECVAPKWFADSINLQNTTEVVIVDDVQGIHQIWKDRLGESVVTHAFDNVSSFEQWLHSSRSEEIEYLFLIDYEIGNDTKNGLDLINEYNLKYSFLVTSHDESKQVLDECIRQNVKVIPKRMIRNFSITKLEPSSPTCVLIDDDAWVQESWQVIAEEFGKSIATYRSYGDFLKNQSSISKSTPIFVDFKLADGERGDIISKKIYDDGFKELFIATGFKLKNKNELKWIKGVIGKKPPIDLFEKNTIKKVHNQA